MPVITLTSDWSKDDYYVAAIKGKILSDCHDATIIDITHKTSNFNIAEAAFILKNSYPYFPSGTIHLICINSENINNRKYLVINYNNQYFIGSDNGIFGLIFKDEPQVIYQLKYNEDKEQTSFPELEIMAKAACWIANKKNIQEIAIETNELNKQIPLRAAIEESVITGSVIYIDSYQNAITNISKELFQRIGKGRPFEINVQSQHYKINRINTKYSDTTPGELLALFNSTGLLEIAIHFGHAGRLLNLEVGSTIIIKFK